MAKQTKTTKTLRQATDDTSKPKKRSIKTPVSKVGKPLKKAAGAVRRGRVTRLLSRLVPKYFKQSWQELREVTWPDRSQTVKLTFAVLAFAAVFGIAIAIVDFGLDKLFREVLLK